MKETIEIVGLGAGEIDQLPLGIYKKLCDAKVPIYTRTKSHPVVQSLQEEGVRMASFDEVYEEEEQFSTVYQKIVNDLVNQAKKQSIIYCVPGHPMLAEKTVQLLLEQNEVDVTISGGQSYLDALFTALRIDPIDGFQFVDGMSFDRRALDYRKHIVFCQVYDPMIASNVKLELLEDLPADYEVTIIEAAGSREEKIWTIPLEEVDRTMEISNLTSIYVPPAPDELLYHTFNQLKEVIATLRGPKGCPWDRKQTHETLRPYAIEEVYELIEAIDREDDDGIVEELGDVLLQVMLHSQIGEDNGYFTIDDVIAAITKKMIHRHPHVFGQTSVHTVEDVHQNWEALKQMEKGKKERQSVLDGVAKSLPSLAKAFHLQKKAAKVGYDWDDVGDIWKKLSEELSEVKEAIQHKQWTDVEEEFGDVLFVLANLTRYYKIDPEIALNRANQKFTRRFSYIEKRLQELGKDIHHTSLEEMDKYWDEAKERE